MARRKVITVSNNQPNIKSPPVLTDEAREQQLVALALDLVEQRLRDGTASSQETVHFLKLGSSREKQERQLRDQELKLAVAKTSAIEAEKDLKVLTEEAIRAMKEYTGQSEED